MSKHKHIRAHYEHRISSGRANHEILDWADAPSQLARFKVLVENVDLAGKRKKLLDVGCGLGDLLAFLKRRKIRVDYTGVDILEKMVHAARTRNPDGRFILADLFADEFADEHFGPGSFDVVFCSGIFNLNLGNNLEFLSVAVERLIALASEHLVFNLLHKRAVGGEDRYFFYDPDWVREMLQPLRCRVTIIDDYLPNDFTVVCRK